MEISIVILSCVILGLNPEMPVFIRLIMICNLNGFRQIKYIHTDERICHRRFIIENYSRGKYTMGPLCNQASSIPHKWRICGYVRTSTQPRRLSGRAHDFCDYVQATTLD